MDFLVTDAVTPEDEAEIYEGLMAYNRTQPDYLPREPLGVYYTDETGKKLAGLVGDTRGNWLHVKYLWVDGSLRGQDMGTRILAAAEAAAKGRGCKYALLDTFSFQAPGFYKKQGYEQIMMLKDYPLTSQWYYFTKEL